MLTQITEFPDEYPCIKQMADSVYWYGALSKEDEEPDLDPEIASWMDYRSLDFFIALRNGEVYSLTGHTLDLMKEVMEREAMKSWVEAGGVVLREVNVDCILDAVENWLIKYELYGFGVGAVLQTNISGEDKGDEEGEGC